MTRALGGNGHLISEIIFPYCWQPHISYDIVHLICRIRSEKKPKSTERKDENLCLTFQHLIGLDLPLNLKLSIFTYLVLCINCKL